MPFVGSYIPPRNQIPNKPPKKVCQIKYVAVRPNGSICGPVGNTRTFVQKSLIIGFAKANSISGKINKAWIWKQIKKLGYSIRKCEIRIID